ncbi:MAG: hypothetical protein ACXV3U_06445 [Halobacteriota archaeon]
MPLTLVVVIAVSACAGSTVPAWAIDISVKPTQRPTDLNASTPPTAFVNQNFSVTGTLTAGSAGIAGAAIMLQRATDSVRFSNVATTTTSTSGGYQFSTNETAVGTYYYRTSYDGNDTYSNATSNVAGVSVSKLPTQLTAAVNPAAANPNQQFTVSGTLITTNNLPILGATILLQVNVSGAWTNVTGNRSTTGQDGSYSIVSSQPNADAYQYRTTYAGDDTHVGNSSAVIAITVFEAPKAPPTLEVAISTSAAKVNQNVTISGTLSFGTTNLQGATVALWRSTDQSTWNNVANNTIADDGSYQFSRNESIANTYYYHTTYAGNDTYTNVTSNVTQLSVTGSASGLEVFYVLGGLAVVFAIVLAARERWAKR